MELLMLNPKLCFFDISGNLSVLFVFVWLPPSRVDIAPIRVDWRDPFLGKSVLNEWLDDRLST